MIASVPVLVSHELAAEMETGIFTKFRLAVILSKLRTYTTRSPVAYGEEHQASYSRNL